MTPTDGSTELDAGARGARQRLSTLFQAFDRLTPDELARIGYQLPPDSERAPLLDAVDEAAVGTGRLVQVAEARDAAREAVMTRYSVGSFRPTFVGLNWGISQGTIESRVAIAETLADAAAAAVVEDALDPEIAAALALDAAAITNMAVGEASEGSLARAIREPADPDLRLGSGARHVRSIAAVAMVAVAVIATGVGLLGAATGVGLLGAAALGVVAGVRAITRGPRRTL